MFARKSYTRNTHKPLEKLVVTIFAHRRHLLQILEVRVATEHSESTEQIKLEGMPWSAARIDVIFDARKPVLCSYLSKKGTIRSIGHPKIAPKCFRCRAIDIVEYVSAFIVQSPPRRRARIAKDRQNRTPEPFALLSWSHLLKKLVTSMLLSYILSTPPRLPLRETNSVQFKFPIVRKAKAASKRRFCICFFFTNKVHRLVELCTASQQRIRRTDGLFLEARARGLFKTTSAVVFQQPWPLRIIVVFFPHFLQLEKFFRFHPPAIHTETEFQVWKTFFGLVFRLG